MENEKIEICNKCGFDKFESWKLMNLFPVRVLKCARCGAVDSNE